MLNLRLSDQDMKREALEENHIKFEIKQLQKSRIYWLQYFWYYFEIIVMEEDFSSSAKIWFGLVLYFILFKHFGILSVVAQLSGIRIHVLWAGTKRKK